MKVGHITCALVAVLPNCKHYTRRIHGQITYSVIARKKFKTFRTELLGFDDNEYRDELLKQIHGVPRFVIEGPSEVKAADFGAERFIGANDFNHW